jgi:hypothetical protein
VVGRGGVTTRYRAIIAQEWPGVHPPWRLPSHDVAAGERFDATISCGFNISSMWSLPGLTHGRPVERMPSSPRRSNSLIVIAGLDPAIQKMPELPGFCATQLDCRVKPGNDEFGGMESARIQVFALPFDEKLRFHRIPLHISESEPDSRGLDPAIQECRQQGALHARTGLPAQGRQ